MKLLAPEHNAPRRRLLAWGSRIAAAFAIGIPAAGLAKSPDRVRFALIGDTPYSPGDEPIFAKVLKAAASEAQFIIHVGDIKGGRESCKKTLLAHRVGLLDSATKPMVVIPGDNEWTDCSRKKAGKYKPVKRLKILRKLMYPNTDALGADGITFERATKGTNNSDHSPDPNKEPEFFRFASGPCLFTAINVPGSNNALTKHISKKFNRRRAALCEQWVHESMLQAERRNLPGLVILLHANLEFGRSRLDDDRVDMLDRKNPYAWVRALLMKMAAQFSGTVLVLHGDRHVFINDHPFSEVARQHKEDGRWGVPIRLAQERLSRLVRVQSFGSPFTARHVVIQASRIKPLNDGDATADFLVATRVLSEMEP
jgi:hypothetical protein